ncbi:MAG: isocitrate/isopropylmalate dehydrogenase family protein [Candidatus Rokubacteria bacterium]|nr:isocitrate/isopropylmalate dehydrogenase family protein [Candidatus Rokubacteria bacterium]
MKTIAALGGEGIGPEVIDATCELLVTAGFPVEIVTPAHGEAAMKVHGTSLPEETKRRCREADGVLFGAAGGPATSSVVQWLRWQQDAYAGVRPVKYYPGASSPLANPHDIDFVVVRENSEGLYPGREGDLAELARALPDLRDRIGRGLADFGEGHFAVKVVSRRGATRIARFACELARRRKARGRSGKVTCITKSNVLRRSDAFFQEIVADTVRSYPGLTFEHFHVDDGARRMIRFPQSMDVVVTMNLYGDILSDIAAEVAGGLGMAPSGCFGDGWAYFESVHGSAPDIAGRGIANPTATILAAAMMLEHMGLAGEADRLEAAVAAVYRAGERLTVDQGGKATTREFCQTVLAALRAG